MTLRQLIFRVLFVVIVAALTATIAHGLSERQAKRYDATTKLLFETVSPQLAAIGIGPGNEDQDRRSVNNTAKVDSFDVARATAEALDDPEYTPGKVANDVDVSNVRGSDVVTIRALASTPEKAAELALRYRQQYFFADIEQVQRAATDARKALLMALSEIPRKNRLGPRAAVLREQIGRLEVLRETGISPKIVEGVRASASPVTPQTARNRLFGGLLGLVLGIGLVALRGATRSPARAGAARVVAPERP